MNEQLDNSGENGGGNAEAAQIWDAAMNGEGGQGSKVIDFNEARVARGMEPVHEQRSQDYYDNFGKDENGNGMNVFDAQDAKHADAMEQYYTRMKRQQESFKGTKYENEYSDSEIAKKLQAFDEKYRNQQGVNAVAAVAEAPIGAVQPVEQPAEAAAQPEQGAQVAENQFGDQIEERDQDYEDYRRQAQEAEAEANGAATETAPAVDSVESEAERLQREQDEADVNKMIAGFQEAEQPAVAQGDGAPAVAAPQAPAMNWRKLDDLEASVDPEARKLIEVQRAQEARETQVEAQNFKRDMDAFVVQSAKKYPRFMSRSRFTVDFGDFWNKMLGRISGGNGSASAA